MTRPYPVSLVAVVGGSGAGKGWFVERLCRVLGSHACHLQLDDFYRDRSHLPPGRRERLNFDVPRAIDWDGAERVLQECRAGRATTLPRYDFATHCRLTQGATWEPRAIVFVDGLWLLRRPALRQLFDLKVYLDTPLALRRSRRLMRDVAERGYAAEDVAERLRTTVFPMHTQYVEPQKKWADVVLPQPFLEDDLLRFADVLWGMLSRAGLVQSWMHETFRAELLDCLMTHEYSH